MIEICHKKSPKWPKYLQNVQNIEILLNPKNEENNKINSKPPIWLKYPLKPPKWQASLIVYMALFES